MPAPGDAEYRVLLAVDIKAFTRSTWSDEDRQWIRQELDGCLARAFRSAGLDADEIMRSMTDTGDGAFYFINAEGYRVIDSVGALRRRLRSFNRRVTAKFRLRIRVAVHAGPVTSHGNTMLGTPVNLTARLLDSAQLRNCLDDDWPDLALAVSDRVFADAIATEHSEHFDQQSFQQVTVDVRGEAEPVRGWLLRREFTRPDTPVGDEPVIVGRLRRLFRARVPISRRRTAPLWLPATLILAVALVTTVVRPVMADACPSPTKLPILADPGMAVPLNRIADTLINRAGECRRADIHVYAADSSEAAVAGVASNWQDTYLVQNGPEPAVWVSGGAAEVAQVQSEPNIPELDVREPIAKGTVIVAMAPEQRDALGLKPTASWADLLEAALSQGGPRLRLIRANPTVSTTALLGTMAMYHSLRGPDAAARRHDVEQVIELAADPEIQTLCKVGAAAAAGEEPPYAAITSEQALNNYNRFKQEFCGASHLDDPELKAIYPADGTYVQDYQYVLLPAAARDPERAEIAEDLYEELRSDEGQQQIFEEGFRDLKGNIDESYGGLTNEPQRRLQTPSGQAVKDAVAQWHAARRPVTTLLAIDVSGSMVESMTGQDTDRMTAARDGVSYVVQRIGSRDRVGLWEFSTLLDGSLDHRELVQVRPVDAQVDGQTQRDEVLGRLGEVQAVPDGDTGLYDTIIDGMGALRAQSDGEALNALIVVTDGLNDDPAGGAGLDKVIEAHRSSDPPVYVALLTFGTAACDSEELTQLTRPQLDCIDAGSIGMDRASEQVSDALWGTP